MVDRRYFLKSLAAGGAAVALNPAELFASQRGLASPYFGVHSFVESHPDAVFIMRTNVDVKTNATAIIQAGLTFGSSVFVPMTTPGIPTSNRIAIKPNIVYMPSSDVQYMGIVTDPHFVEGVIQSLKLLGFAGSQFYLREVNYPDMFANSGYTQMAARTGADLRAMDQPVGTIPESDLQWVDVPNGKWFKRIPYLWPVNAPNTWLLNISKFKTHSMGMTLCAKNLQGTIAQPYVVHCTPYNETWNLNADHVQPNAKAQILADYERHVSMGIPRWDRPGEADGGLRMECWAARCIDNNSVTHPGLHIIEGVYGREGPFEEGPGPSGEGLDHMTNMIIFGKNPFHVDNVGLWLGGHDPRNFGLIHIAFERGMSTIWNPQDIPLYEWHADGSAVATSLGNFTRANLRTQYLRRDYDGQTENEWHLVNEPYEGPVPVQLTAFAASIDMQTGRVTLKWATASETNNYGFQVLRRREDGIEYAVLPDGFVPGHGTTTMAHEYSFVDSSATQGRWWYRLKQIDLDGAAHYLEPVSVDVLTGVSTDKTPTEYALLQNYPNPFNPTTTIRFTIAGVVALSGTEGPATKVRLAVYDLLGREVKVLMNERKEPGRYEVTWDATGFASGDYICLMTAGTFVESRRMLLLQ
jgi:uncharacterized protein (DUF362 family)